jgi:predicted nucleic acid-binding protein
VILVDTSIWIDHFRETNPQLSSLLLSGSVSTHELVLEELALGGLHHVTEVSNLLANLPRLPNLRHFEVMHLISSRRLASSGIGVVDARLLGAVIAHGGQLWTRDSKLRTCAEQADVSYKSL